MVAFVVFERDILPDLLEKVDRLKGGLLYGSQASVLSLLLLVSEGEVVSAGHRILTLLHPLKESVIPEGTRNRSYRTEQRHAE